MRWQIRHIGLNRWRVKHRWVQVYNICSRPTRHPVDTAHKFNIIRVQTGVYLLVPYNIVFRLHLY